MHKSRTEAVWRNSMAGTMKVAFVTLALMLLHTGCIPLRQAARVSGPDYPSLLLCDDRYVLVGIDMNHENIVADQSHIADPKGQRYSIQVEPHQYDIERKFAAIRANVYPCDPDGLRLRRWANGTWSFHFVVETNGVTTVVDQQWRYWTFYYNPIVHGPPN